MFTVEIEIVNMANQPVLWVCQAPHCNMKDLNELRINIMVEASFLVKSIKGILSISSYFRHDFVCFSTEAGNV